MASEVNDGGPAFPHPTECRKGTEIPHLGISKLEWLTGQALNGILSSDTYLKSLNEVTKTADQLQYAVAATAVQQAEVTLRLLAARSKGGES